MNTLEQLIAARELIAKGWTQGAPARAVDGGPTPSWDSDAVRWCATGALRAVEDDLATTIALAAALPEPSCGRACCSPITTIQTLKNIASFNDHPTTTQADVLALYDRAIQGEA